jgi:hypothetical protein
MVCRERQICRREEIREVKTAKQIEKLKERESLSTPLDNENEKRSSLKLTNDARVAECVCAETGGNEKELGVVQVTG